MQDACFNSQPAAGKKSDKSEQEEFGTDRGDNCPESKSWQAMESGVSNNLKDIWGASDTDMWATGENGILLHFDGSIWAVVAYDLADTFYKIAGIESDNIWVAGHMLSPDEGGTKPVFYHYDGQDWNQSNTDFMGRFRDMAMFDNGDLYAVGEHFNQGRIWKFSNQTWSSVEMACSGIKAIWGASSEDFFLIVENFQSNQDEYESAVVRYDGSGFQKVAHAEFDVELEQIFGIGPDVVWVSGYNRQSRKSVLYQLDGLALIPTAIPVESQINDFWGIGPNKVFAAADTGEILFYDGSNWILTPTGLMKSNNKGIWGFDSGKVFSVGGEGAVFQYTCAEQNTQSNTDEQVQCDWEDIRNETMIEYNDIWSYRDKSFHLATDHGIFFYNSDGVGYRIWDRSQTDINSIWSWEDQRMVAVGREYELGSDTESILILLCDSQECEEVQPKYSGALNDVFGFSAGQIFAAGIDRSNPDNKSLLIQFDGMEWTHLIAPGNLDFQSIWGNTATDIWVAANDWEQETGNILHFNGEEWKAQVSELPIVLYDLWGTAEDNIYSAGWDYKAPDLHTSPFGMVIHFDGESWNEILASDTTAFTSVFVQNDDLLLFGTLEWNPINESTTMGISQLKDNALESMPLCVEKNGYIKAIHGVMEGQIFAIGNEATIYSLF